MAVQRMQAEDNAWRIGLIGGECTGKSTLAEDLASALRTRLPGQVHVVPEVLRAFVAEHGRPPHRSEQRAIMSAQVTAEQAAMRSADPARSTQLSRADGSTLVCDPAALMTAVYSEVYFHDRSLWRDALAHARSYRLLLWCRPDLPWVGEPGQRDGPQYRLRADAVIAQAIADRLLPAGIAVHQVTGDRDARLRRSVACVMDAWAWAGAWHPDPPSAGT